MVNTEIRLIIFFAAKDGAALYSQQKQDQHIKKQRHYFAKKDPSSQSYDFSNSHVWM